MLTPNPNVVQMDHLDLANNIDFTKKKLHARMETCDQFHDIRSPAPETLSICCTCIVHDDDFLPMQRHSLFLLTHNNYPIPMYARSCAKRRCIVPPHRQSLAQFVAWVKLNCFTVFEFSLFVPCAMDVSTMFACKLCFPFIYSKYRHRRDCSSSVWNRASTPSLSLSSGANEENFLVPQSRQYEMWVMQCNHASTLSSIANGFSHTGLLTWMISIVSRKFRIADNYVQRSIFRWPHSAANNCPSVPWVLATVVSPARKKLLENTL